MHFTQEQLLNYLRTHNIAYQLYTHPQLFTCEQAAEIVAQLHLPGMGIKNLFLKDSKKKALSYCCNIRDACRSKNSG